MQHHQILCVWWVKVWNHVWTCEGQRLALAASSISCHFYVLKQGLSLNFKLINLVRLAGQWTSGICPHSQEGDYRYLLLYPAFYVSSADLNSGLWAYEADTSRSILKFYIDTVCRYNMHIHSTIPAVKIHFRVVNTCCFYQLCLQHWYWKTPALVSVCFSVFQSSQFCFCGLKMF